MHLLTYSHHFKECFHYPKELILISSNLILFHVNRKLATATENILQVSLPTVAELNPLSRALIIISQFAALVSEEVMWLPREARVGVSPALSRATKSKKENTGAPSPPSPTIAHHRTEENHELRNVSLGQRKVQKTRDTGAERKEQYTSGDTTESLRLWVAESVTTSRNKIESLSSA